MVGQTMRHLPESYLVTIRPGSLTPSRRRFARAPFLSTLVGHLLTGRRSGSHISAPPTNTPTGRQRTTASRSQTRSTTCSTGLGPPTPTVSSPPCVASYTERWPFTLLAISMCRRPASQAKTASSLMICLPTRIQSAPPCSTPSTGSDRWMSLQDDGHAHLRPTRILIG